MRTTVIATMAAAAMVAGCAAPAVRRVCPGQQDLSQALAKLRQRSGTIEPLKAYGRCLLRYKDKNGKLKKENFPLKLWLNPPAEIYLQGDVGFNPKGIVLGSNQHEFWLAIKPKQISSYWWGKWSQQEHIAGVPLSPVLLLDAFGATKLDGYPNLTLSNERAYDVLTVADSNGHVFKKIYIYCCDYLVRKIEYFGRDGRLKLVVTLDNYRQVHPKSYAPTLIEINSPDGNTLSRWATIRLSSLKPMRLTPRQRKVMFSRPDPHRYRHEYLVTGGNIVELKR